MFFHSLSPIYVSLKNHIKLILFLIAININPLLLSINYSFKKLTILTQHIGSTGSEQGHPMVTRSLIAGLKQLKIPFNYNPTHKEDVGDVVVVLANTRALSQVLLLKQNNPNITLLAGPNLVVWPTDDQAILLSQTIDGIIVPSEPTRHMYAEISPTIKNRLYIWYAGVDIHQWKPFSIEKKKKVLVYWKNQSEGPALKNKVVNLLTRYGWHPIVLEYGSHTQDMYKKILDTVNFGIFLSRSESQGIALAEAWAMNVPTFPWNPQYRENRGKIYSAVSSCPYLSKKTGKDWKEIIDLEQILKKLEQSLEHFSPRKWVLNHMTDTISSELLIDIINNVQANISDICLT